DYDVNTGRYIQADPIGLAGDDNPYAYARGNPLRYADPLGLKCNSRGCWLTPQEKALAASGDYEAYYSEACAGGDIYACRAREVATNKGWQAHFTNWNLKMALGKAHADGSGCEAAMVAIRRALAMAHAGLLSEGTEGRPVVLTARQISVFHNVIFKLYGADRKYVPVFGGDFPMSNDLFQWCTLPSCRPW
ncbi:MAG TPA: hypothetical protein DIU09_14545, partial [Hyphomonadaceae bacterium]|nr:hypothetical protein [Hyphomonadaceae bacterium]